ncbi:MAG: BON domain-containing protein [Pseudogulbenkiania sp.]|nr:BON domain-containing protein [Pseudogulbenkiania sp.]
MKQRVFASKLVMALLAATLLPAQFALGDEASDAALAAKVKAAIDANPTLKAFDLKVSGKSNDVTIEGSVDEGLQMAEVGMIAEKIEGVKFVFNKIMPKN